LIRDWYRAGGLAVPSLHHDVAAAPTDLDETVLLQQATKIAAR
jgi:hypothetical protein